MNSTSRGKTGCFYGPHLLGRKKKGNKKMIDGRQPFAAKPPLIAEFN
jgi:hypothetical protein